MSTDRQASVALIAGVAAGLLTMAVHPTGHDIVANATAGRLNLLNTGAHVLALAGEAFLAAGLFTFTARLRRRAAAVPAFACFALATVTVTVGAVASGFVAPATVAGIAGADDSARAAMLGAMHFTGQLNRAFVGAYVMLSSIAIALWSAALLREPALSRALGSYGLLASAALFVTILTGRLGLDIHGFGLVVLAQGVWFVGVASALWRGMESDPASP